jgi:hypothetical protein
LTVLVAAVAVDFDLRQLRLDPAELSSVRSMSAPQLAHGQPHGVPGAQSLLCSVLLQVGVVMPHRADRVGKICHEVGDNTVQQNER